MSEQIEAVEEQIAAIVAQNAERRRKIDELRATEAERASAGKVDVTATRKAIKTIAELETEILVDEIEAARLEGELHLLEAAERAPVLSDAKRRNQEAQAAKVAAEKAVLLTARDVNIAQSQFNRAQMEAQQAQERQKELTARLHARLNKGL